MFALPFALTGALLASREHPLTWSRVGWIVAAMVAARSAAMGFNRLVDARYDALNPRTAMREMPRGDDDPAGGDGVRADRVGGVCLRVVEAEHALRDALAGRARDRVLVLDGQALHLVTRRRFSGLAMAVAPVGGWLAAGGGAGWEPWLLGAAIGLWVGGFDVLYACQDEAFDRAHGLRSIPVRFGIARSLTISRVMHVGAVVCMALLGVGRAARPRLSRRRRARRGAPHLRTIAREPRRSLAGEDGRSISTATSAFSIS